MGHPVSASVDGDFKSPKVKAVGIDRNDAAKPTKRPGGRRRMSKLTLRGKPKAVAADLCQLLNSPSTRKDSRIQTFLMKAIPLIIFALTSSVLPGSSQIALTRNSSAFATRTYIAHSLEVPDFIPPAPPVRKEVPTMRVNSAVTILTGNSHTLTVLRGAASQLPDIPVPVALEAAPRRQPTPEELARYAEERRRRLNFNAVVHENGVSVIRWRHPDTEEPYEAICGFDVNLLAGLGRFTSDDKIYELSFIPPGVLPASRHRSGKFPAPNPPAAAPDSVTLIQGDATDAVGTATVTLLRDLIANEKARLTAFQADRARHQAAASAWAEAHPVLPRNETFWLRPHRGSRYLANPRPEAKIR